MAKPSAAKSFKTAVVAGAKRLDEDELEWWCANWFTLKKGLAVLSSIFKKDLPLIAKVIDGVITWGDKAYPIACARIPKPGSPG